MIEVDYVNYKKPSMIIACPICDFKCDKECGQQICQNCAIAKQKDITIDDDVLINKYLKGSSRSICFQGLEPFDTSVQMMRFIHKFRQVTNDDVVIYTGYNKDEISEQIKSLKQYPNIIIKFGRYIPDQQPHYDEVLGVELASDNQYAEKIN